MTWPKLPWHCRAASAHSGRHPADKQRCAEIMWQYVATAADCCSGRSNSRLSLVTEAPVMALDSVDLFFSSFLWQQPPLLCTSAVLLMLAMAIPNTTTQGPKQRSPPLPPPPLPPSPPTALPLSSIARFELSGQSSLAGSHFGGEALQGELLSILVLVPQIFQSL